MNTRGLEKTARRLSYKLQPQPRLIHCAGAKEELLTMLEQQIKAEGGDINAPVAWSEEQTRFANELSAWLEHDCQEIELRYNVRFV